jgi:hypothetical protein
MSAMRVLRLLSIHYQSVVLSEQYQGAGHEINARMATLGKMM